MVDVDSALAGGGWAGAFQNGRLSLTSGSRKGAAGAQKGGRVARTFQPSGRIVAVVQQVTRCPQHLVKSK